jgi:hypothetical protein
MTSVHLSRAKLYHQRIRQASLLEWDPIGIGHDPDAQDEYDSYVSTLYKMLITEQPQQEIFEYLWWVETEYMGLTGNRGYTEQFANRLIQMRSELKDCAI